MKRSPGRERTEKQEWLYPRETELGGRNDLRFAAKDTWDTSITDLKESEDR